MQIKKILALFAVLFIACSALHLVEPTSAVNHKKGYLIDHGVKYGTHYFISDGVKYHYKYKLFWKTYWYSKNKRTTVVSIYDNILNRWSMNSAREYITLEKVSKTKMKIRYSGDGFTTYKKTKLNTRNYYWKKFRPTIGHEFYDNANMVNMTIKNKVKKAHKGQNVTMTLVIKNQGTKPIYNMVLENEYEKNKKLGKLMPGETIKVHFTSHIPTDEEMIKEGFDPNSKEYQLALPELHYKDYEGREQSEWFTIWMVKLI